MENLKSFYAKAPNLCVVSAIAVGAILLSVVYIHWVLWALFGIAAVFGLTYPKD